MHSVSECIVVPMDKAAMYSLAVIEPFTVSHGHEPIRFISAIPNTSPTAVRPLQGSSAPVGE